MGEKQLSAAQRGELFQYSTRQNWHMLPKRTVKSGGEEIRFDLPKARLLSRLLINFDVKFNVSHPSKTDVPVDDFTPYKFVQKINLDCNNGFSPYTIGGIELGIFNALRLDPGIIFPQSSDEGGYCYMPELIASPEGEQNHISFTVELSTVLNNRDPLGLVVLQSPESVITLSIFNANGSAIIPTKEGYKVDIVEFTATPAIETFSIPAAKEAFPDIGVLKTVNHRTYDFTGGGQNIVNLPTNTVHRKMAFYFTDNDDNPLSDDDFIGNIELVFNQTDTNYSLHPKLFRHFNQLSYHFALPKGVYVLDFTDNGFPNYGGSRDYIDSTKMTELWLRFNTSKPGKVRMIFEQISFAE